MNVTSQIWRNGNSADDHANVTCCLLTLLRYRFLEEDLVYYTREGNAYKPSDDIKTKVADLIGAMDVLQYGHPLKRDTIVFPTTFSNRQIRWAFRTIGIFVVCK